MTDISLDKYVDKVKNYIELNKSNNIVIFSDDFNSIKDLSKMLKEIDINIKTFFIKDNILTLFDDKDNVKNSITDSGFNEGVFINLPLQDKINYINNFIIEVD
jgi:hypothetical protein